MELPSASGNTKVVEKGRRLVDADKVGACSYTLSDENIYLTGLLFFSLATHLLKLETILQQVLSALRCQFIMNMSSVFYIVMHVHVFMDIE